MPDLPIVLILVLASLAIAVFAWRRAAGHDHILGKAGEPSISPFRPRNPTLLSKGSRDEGL